MAPSIQGASSQSRQICREIVRVLQRDEETMEDILIMLSRVARHNRRWMILHSGKFISVNLRKVSITFYVLTLMTISESHDLIQSFRNGDK